MAARIAQGVLILALAGCASLPDPDDCWEYGVETRPEHQPPFVQCDTVEEIALPRDQVMQRCAVYGPGVWGCVVRGAFPVDRKTHCRLYWYEKDRWVLYHERCHVAYGPRHVQPMTVGEIWDELRN